MALLFLEGFDNLAASDLLMEWTASTNPTYLSTVAGRGGQGSAVRGTQTSGNNPSLSKTLASTITTVVCGFALRVSYDSASLSGLAFTEGGVERLYVYATATGVSIYRVTGGTGTPLVTGSLPASALNNWVYIEAKIALHGSTGTAELRADGQIIGTFTGQTFTGSVGVNGFKLQFGNYTNGNTCDFDDLVVMDGTTTAHNGFQGPCQVRTILPTGAGDSAQFGRGGADSGANWSQVDESPANGDTDFVFSSTAGTRDLYAMADVPGGAIKAVVVGMIAKLDTSGSREAATIVKAGGVESAGVSKALTTAYKAYEEVLPLDPNGNPWTATTVNGVQAGVKVTV